MPLLDHFGVGQPKIAFKIRVRGAAFAFAAKAARTFLFGQTDATQSRQEQLEALNIDKEPT
jgi:hypothetical protein